MRCLGVKMLFGLLKGLSIILLHDCVVVVTSARDSSEGVIFLLMNGGHMHFISAVIEIRHKGTARHRLSTSKQQPDRL